MLTANPWAPGRYLNQDFLVNFGVLRNHLKLYNYTSSNSAKNLPQGLKSHLQSSSVPSDQLLSDVMSLHRPSLVQVKLLHLPLLSFKPWTSVFVRRKSSHYHPLGSWQSKFKRLVLMMVICSSWFCFDIWGQTMLFFSSICILG